MKLYRTTFGAQTPSGIGSQWFPNRGAAERFGKALEKTGQNVAENMPKPVVTHEEVPTNKEGLLGYLNSTHGTAVKA
jgi:hypothetical protein